MGSFWAPRCVPALMGTNQAPQTPQGSSLVHGFLPGLGGAPGAGSGQGLGVISSKDVSELLGAITEPHWVPSLPWLP